MHRGKIPLFYLMTVVEEYDNKKDGSGINGGIAGNKWEML